MKLEDLMLLYCKLFSVFYYLFLYSGIFFYLKYWDGVTCKNLIFKKRLERSTIIEIFLISSFVLFLFLCKLMFRDLDKGNLVNPLQVTGQLTCYLFYIKSDILPIKKKYLFLISFFLCLGGCLYLEGIDWKVLFFFMLSLFFLILKSIIPLDYLFILLFFLYFFDQGLAKWGFYLAFQLGCYFILSFFLDKRKPKKGVFLGFLLLLIVQLIYAFLNFQEFYLMEPLKLAVLLSGASILFLSFKERTRLAFLIPFFIYFCISLFIWSISSPTHEPTLWGIPHGMLIFLFFHLWAFVAFFIFGKTLPKKKHALIALFYSALFYFFQQESLELPWLEKWLSGIDFLLLLLGICHLLEEENEIRIWPKKKQGYGYHDRSPSIKKNLSK